MAYGYPGDATPDTNSSLGIGDSDNQLLADADHQSAALTVEGRQERFGVTGKSTGLPFEYNGKTYYDDDTAPTDFTYNGEPRHNDPGLVDPYDPSHPPDNVSGSGSLSARKSSFNADPESLSSQYPGDETEAPEPQEKHEAPKEDPGVPASLFSPQLMVAAIKNQIPAYSGKDEGELWQKFVDKFPKPIDQIKAIYPKYKKLDSEQLEKAIHHKFYPLDTDEEFQQRINPLDDYSKGALYTWQNTVKSWFETVGNMAQFPERAQLLGDKFEDWLKDQGWVGQIMTQGIEAGRLKQGVPGVPVDTRKQLKNLADWGKNYADTSDMVIKAPHTLDEKIEAKIGAAIGGIPDILPTFGAGLGFGLIYQGVQADAQAKEKGLDNHMALGGEAISMRAIQHVLLNTPMGRVFSGFAWMLENTTDEQAKKFLSGDKNNDLDDLLATAAIGWLFGAAAGHGIGKMPEESQQALLLANHARQAHDLPKAAELMDKAMLALPDSDRAKIGQLMLTFKRDAVITRPTGPVIRQPGPPAVVKGEDAIRVVGPTGESPSGKPIRIPPTQEQLTASRFNQAQFDEFYSGFGNGKQVIEHILNKFRDLNESDLRKGLMEVWNPQKLSKEHDVTGRLLKEGTWIKKVRENTVMDLMVRKQQMRDEYLFSKNPAKREAFWDGIPKGQLKQQLENAQNGHSVSPVFDHMWQLHKLRMDQIAKFDQAHGFGYRLRDSYIMGLLKNKKDIDRLESYVRKRWGDPDFVHPKVFEDLTHMHALGFEMKDYNLERIDSLREAQSFDAENKSWMLDQLHSYGMAFTPQELEKMPESEAKQIKEQSELFKSPKSVISTAIDNKGRKLTSRSPVTFYVHKSAAFMLHRAFDPADVEGGQPYKIAKKWFLNPAEWIKYKTIQPALAWSGFHPLHIQTIQIADDAAFSLGKFIDGGGKIEDAGNVLASALTGGISSTVKAVRGKHTLMDFYEAKAGLKDLSPADQDRIAYQRRGGLVPYMNQERASQLVKLFNNIPHGNTITKSMDLGWRIVTNRDWQHFFFGKVIPSLKMHSYDLAVAEMLRKDPKLVDPARRMEFNGKLQALANATEAHFGEITMDNVFWPKYIKHIGRAVMLSQSWTLAFLRTYGGAAHDMSMIPARVIDRAKALKDEQSKAPKDRILTNKLLFAGALTVTGATMMGLLSAINGGGDEPEDYIYGVVGKDKKGQKMRVKPPFWLNTDVMSMYKHIKDENGNVLLAGGDFFGNKMQPGLASIYQAIRGKDYFGNDIAANDEWFGQQAWDKTLYVFRNAFTAFTFQNMQVPGHDPAETFVLGLLGLPRASKYDERTSIENEILKSAQTYVFPKGKTKQAMDRAAAYANLSQAEEDGKKDRIAESIKKLKELGVTDKQIEYSQKHRDETPGMHVLRELSGRAPEEAKRIYKSMSPEDKKKYKKFLSEKVQQEVEQ